MGEVWMAQQTEPVKRIVAVKLIKPGMDSRMVLARFEVERQALAIMDHANIARVFDAGVSEDGRPFFVMELVKGVPITQFCDSRRMTPRQRLELFVPVCQAVQHAHQKGVIHRDLKPSNVLVAMSDDKPVPKVIDFGVAKAIGQPLTDQTLHTGFGTVIGTPQYMSPEQATFNNLDVDTRSDLYSLGVILYELLAGSPPFSKKELRDAGILEMLRVVREEEPPRPSTKLSTADALPSLAANRSTEPKKLTGMLRNELDWIVMKALEKNRTRRYETANGFAADVQRYLSGEPVQAVPPSMAYRLGKFVSKNRLLVRAVAIVFLVLVLGITGTTFGLVRAEKARDDAIEAQRKEALQRLEADEYFQQAFRAVDDYLTKVSENRLLKEPVPGMQPLRKELLEAALKYYQTFAANRQNDPNVRVELARAYGRVGKIKANIGSTSEATEADEKSRDVWQTLCSENPDNVDFQWEYIDTLRRIAHNKGRQPGSLLEGIAGLESALALNEAVIAAHSNPGRLRLQHVELLTELGALLHEGGRVSKSLEKFDQALVLYQELSPGEKLGDESFLAGLLLDYGFAQRVSGLMTESIASLEKALEIFKRLEAAEPNLIRWKNDQASIYANLGYYHRWNTTPEQALAAYQNQARILGELVRNNPSISYFSVAEASVIRTIADMQVVLGKPFEALQNYRLAIGRNRQMPLDQLSNDVRAGNLVDIQFYGVLLGRLGRIDEALKSFLEAKQGLEELMRKEPDHYAARDDLPWVLLDLGNLHARTGKPLEAVEAHKKAVVILEGIRSQDDNAFSRGNVGEGWTWQGIMLMRLGRPAEARESAMKALEWLVPLAAQDPKNGLISEDLARALVLAGAAHASLKQSAEARDHYSRCLTELKRLNRHPHPELLYYSACSHAGLSSLVGVGNNELTDMEAAEQKQLADRAITDLEMAVGTGYWDLYALQKDSSLEAVRSRPEYAKLIKQVEAKIAEANK